MKRIVSLEMDMNENINKNVSAQWNWSKFHIVSNNLEMLGLVCLYFLEIPH